MQHRKKTFNILQCGVIPPVGHMEMFLAEEGVKAGTHCCRIFECTPHPSTLLVLNPIQEKSEVVFKEGKKDVRSD